MNINILILLMGLSCFSAQVLFIREFLIQFYGNELTIGIILGAWLLSESLGSFIFGIIKWNKNNSIITYFINQVLVFILFPLSIFTTRIIKQLLGISAGQGLGITPILLFSFLIILPLGLLLGGQFPLLSIIRKFYKKESLYISVSKSYFLEALGFALGGFIITYLLIPHINSIGIAFIIAFLNLICGSVLLLKQKKFLLNKYLPCFLLIFFIIGSFIHIKIVPVLHKSSIEQQWNKFKVVEYENSIYGNITVIKQNEQYAFFYNAMPLLNIPVPDIIYTEDIAYFALSSIDDPQNIAVIGSGLGGIINNILKFNISSLDYTEIDPQVIKMIRKYPSQITKKELNDPRVNVHNIDARLFLKKNNNYYDAAIMNLPIPSTLIINRFYTKEFFDIIYKKLNNNGIFCFTLPGSESYMSKEQSQLNQCILNTLKEVFDSVFVIPGNHNIYIASKNKSFNITPKMVLNSLKSNNIETVLFTDFYLKQKLNKQKQAWFLSNIAKEETKINYDLNPSAVSYSLLLWNALFSENSSRNLIIRKIISSPSFIFIAIIIMFFLLLQARPTQKTKLIIPVVFINGLVAVSLNIILLLCLQTFYGYIYLHIGFFISSFMIGLTAGGITIVRRIDSIKSNFQEFIKMDKYFTLFCMVVYFSLILLKTFDPIYQYVPIILLSLSFFCGFFNGYEFPLANKIFHDTQSNKKQSNILYAIDMLGSFFGSIFTCIILIPTIGIQKTLVLFFLIKMVSLLKLNQIKLRRK